jgi:glucose/arabinose dehydrogenase
MNDPRHHSPPGSRPRNRASALALALCFLPLLAWTPAAEAQITPGDFVIDLVPVADGLTAPLGVTHANDGSGRLFIWQQTGQILIVDAGGNLLPTPFLDIADRMVELSDIFDERGFLGLAFHPDYANNGRFFVRYSAPREGDPDEPCSDPGNFIPGCHKEVLAEFAVTADPNVADPASEIVLFEVDEPQFNHNSGGVHFGPDGYLYFTLGDGGGGGDGLADDPPSHGPMGNGQNIETPLGSMLRLDVDSDPEPGLPYAIPDDNPFVGVAGLDEIYAYGFRNAFRFSFDDGLGGTGALYAADVGQNLYEELNIVELGGNYGWVIREGFHCFDPFNPDVPPADCADTGPLGEPLLDPIVEYEHADGGLSIIGGFVYRGFESPSLMGTYVFGDWSADFGTPSGRLYYLEETGPDTYAIREFQIGEANVPYDRFLLAFGEDEVGEIYVCGSSSTAPTGDTGVVHRLQVQATVPAQAAAQLQAVDGQDGILLSWGLVNFAQVEDLVIERWTDGQAPERVAAWSGQDALERRSWIDQDAAMGQSYHYRLAASGGGIALQSNEVSIDRSVPAAARSKLLAVAPNPFNPSTRISFLTAAEGRVSLRILDPRGRTVRSYRWDAVAPGEISVQWDGRNDARRAVPSGVYLVHLETAKGSDFQRITLLK